MINHLPERLHRKIVEGPIDTYAGSACWIWVGTTAGNGYGRVKIPGTKSTVSSHRLVFETLVGPIPPGLDLDHLCRVRACCNPAHLEPVTRAENLKRGVGSDVGKINRAKTHCPAGHPYDEENTWRSKKGRHCRQCHREKRWLPQGRKLNPAAPKPPRPPKGHHQKAKTHCPAGHPYDKENTAVYDGRRNCKTCRNAKSRLRYKQATLARMITGN